MVLGDLYARLAPQVPYQYTSPYIGTAKGKLSEALVACVGRYRRHGDRDFDAFVRRRVSDDLQALGIGAERVELLGHTRTRQEHLALYARVDIALDTFPYNGTTTTCESLWMGVPVIAKEGDSHVSRVSVSLLGAVGLSGLVAATDEDYVALAAFLALRADPEI